ncbi:type 4a pilus biogenesis protein PilO [Candidatus Sororendozoicomonas aggregata]|uniref:type 4a pilus biogenesis protein PilO n=1 Tax=Candidatus Sororendozoicomonas aggregata TaxID=3073239 RepID=UPI002ECFCC23
MNMIESIKKLNDIDFNNIDFENIGDWPPLLKTVSCALSFIIIIFLGYQIHLTGLQDSRKHIQNSENSLKEQYRIKAYQAANLEVYQTQIIDMEKHFQKLVLQLPGDTEVPGLLDDITYTARGSGLQVEHIKLLPEKINEFYVELPISVLVKGSYHDFGNFVSGVSALSRIVTLHDLTIKSDSSTNQLTMDILAKTYRYKDKEAE